MLFDCAAPPTWPQEAILSHLQWKVCKDSGVPLPHANTLRSPQLASQHDHRHGCSVPDFVVSVIIALAFLALILSLACHPQCDRLNQSLFRGRLHQVCCPPVSGTLCNQGQFTAHRRKPCSLCTATSLGIRVISCRSAVVDHPRRPPAGRIRVPARHAQPCRAPSGTKSDAGASRHPSTVTVSR